MTLIPLNGLFLRRVAAGFNLNRIVLILLADSC